MELRHFRYFVAVAEELSFTKAARRLHISQPPLSQHVQDLERELGAVLFDRNRGHVSLTEAGSLFLSEAKVVLSQAAHAVDVAKRAGRGEVGVLRVGFTATAPFTRQFSRVVQAYRHQLPHVRLALTFSTTEPILEALRMSELDIGLIRPSASAVLPDNITRIPVRRDRLMVALHAHHPLALSGKPVAIQDLADEPFVLRPDGVGAGFYEQVYALCNDAGFAPHLEQEANEAATILGLVAAGLGVTILPASLQAIAVTDVVWRELIAGGNTISVLYLVFRADEGNTFQRSCFVELMQEFSEKC
jgi:DNA-binding transcriptional LysR family regulator